MSNRSYTCAYCGQECGDEGSKLDNQSSVYDELKPGDREFLKARFGRDWKTRLNEYGMVRVCNRCEDEVAKGGDCAND